MAIACLNAVFAPPQTSRVKEIILEGFHAPFDDIELRKEDGTYTFFQSKHRDTAGGNNITIGELTSIPTLKETEKKSVNTAFSLAKYFKGFILQCNNAVPIDNINFVICVSAGFSTKFKAKGTKVFTSLEANTWSTFPGGILQELPPEKIDTLFTEMKLRERAPLTITDAMQGQGLLPQYLRFSDSFISGMNLTPSQTILRQQIFNAIKTFVDNESSVDWVNRDILKRTDDYIGYFLRNLQLWINQPKLQKLKEIANIAFLNNFTIGADEIYRHFYDEIKQSSDRKTRSLDLSNIEQHLRRARGMVLCEALRTRADDYHEEHLLGSIRTSQNLTSLNQFLIGTEKICILVSSEPERLKYLVSTAMQPYDSNQCCVIDANCKPIFHEHVIAGEIDHALEDLFWAKKYKVVAIDNIHYLLNSVHGRKQLRVLINQNSSKIILICNAIEIEALHAIVGLNCVELRMASITLIQEELQGLLSSLPNQTYSHPLKGGTLQRLTDIFNEMPSLATSLLDPLILVNFIHTLRNSDLPTNENSASFIVPNYFSKPVSLPQPIYHLSDLAKQPFATLCFSNIDTRAIPALEEVIGCLAERSPDKKNFYFRINKGHGHLFLKIHEATQDNNVIIEGYATDNSPYQILKRWPACTAKGFISKQENVSAYTFILETPQLAQRLLINADYGTGKSSLLKQLFGVWLNQEVKSRLYEWVIPCQLTQMTELIRNNCPLIEIIIAQLEQQKLIAVPVQLWVRATIREAIARGSILLLLDKWDELYENQYPFMQAWLQKLPSSLSFVIASRPHAINELKIPFHQIVKLQLFTWRDIESFIRNYFESLSLENKIVHDQFLENLFCWLENGNNPEITRVLERPLHVKLLVDALRPHYESFCQACTIEERDLIELQAPWHNTVFYRLKLYQLILAEQFRKYLHDQVQACPVLHASEMRGVNLFTQTHQLRLREIGFKLIFDEEPIQLVSAVDEQLLLNELYNLGILTARSESGSKIEFVYRIFSEYFAALYLLNALLRKEDDFICKKMVKLIQKHASNPRFKEVWIVLGEMIRYGEPFLNFEGIGPNKDALLRFPVLAQDDSLGFYYTYLNQCLNGLELDDKYQFNSLADLTWYISKKANAPIMPMQIESYVGKSPRELFEIAKSNKNKPRGVVCHMVATGQLTEGWLYYFFYKNMSTKYIDDNLLQLSRTLEPSLINLSQLEQSFKWPEESFGNYWDIDGYLPTVIYMFPKLYIMGAAYFIHRILNRRNVYYDTQVPQAALGIIFNLMTAEFDIDSAKLYSMMVIMWLSKPYLITNPGKTVIPGLLTMVFRNLACNDSDLKMLSINLLYSLSYVFKFKIKHEIDGSETFQITNILQQDLGKYLVTSADALLLTTQFYALKSNFKMSFPTFALDGSDLVQSPPPTSITALTQDFTERLVLNKI